MMRRPSPHLLVFLILVLLSGGLEVTFADIMHADHAEGLFAHANGDEPVDQEHEEHCCHISIHLVGAVTDARLTDLLGASTLQRFIRRLSAGPRAPPPTPPPTA